MPKDYSNEMQVLRIYSFYCFFEARGMRSSFMLET